MEIRTVADLLAALEGLDPNMPVRMAQQPSWPFEYTIGSAGLVVVDGVEGFWLGEGSQVGYLPGQVAFDLGWSENDPSQEDECRGHPAGPDDPMGQTVYCDGSCRG